MRVLLLLLSSLCSALAGADAINFKKLLMPGKLAAAHAKLESDCDNCHVSFAKEAQGKLCAECHKAVAADLADRRGFHGRLDPQTVMNCKRCHSDHLGRNADIVGLDRAHFDHMQTDFPLTGKHNGLECGKCHAEGTKFRAASSECYACHRSDDRHRGALGRQCESCHVADAWKQVRFDHDKTQFALLGAHRQARCNACHADERFRNTPRACASCHRKDDAHNGAFGTRCASCHNENDWKQAVFDHARDAHFALRGAHAATQCNSCHRPSAGGTVLLPDKLSRACVSCHRADDKHKGRFGTRCESCHNEVAWSQQKFDHASTQFALLGKHAELACNACHRTNLHDTLPRDCGGCHRDDDAHKGQLGTRCESCHNAVGWKKDVVFDHAQTRFPLTAAHAGLACGRCHAGATFADASPRCVACHERDDKHAGAFGARCDSCHATGSWKGARFDHAQTQFALTGAHVQLQCGDCHREPADTVKLARDCFSCHAVDDEHDGRFGRDCERCHNTRDFRDVDFKAKGLLP